MDRARCYLRNHPLKVSSDVFTLLLWECLDGELETFKATAPRDFRSREIFSLPILWNLSIVNSHGTQRIVHYTGVFTQEVHQGFHIPASSSECYPRHQQKYQTD